MNERRGFYTAAGTTLVGIGIAGFRAYYIGQSALTPSQRGAYVFVPVACEVITVVGLGLIIAFWISLIRHRMQVNEVNLFVSHGTLLLRQVGYGMNLTDQQIEEFEVKIEEWSRKVANWLRGNLAEYSAHFINLSGTPMTEALFGTDRRRLLITSMDARLRRLSEIQMKL
jgi:hypothetical protein